MGGKSKLINTLLKHTPYHERFLSLFTGSGIYEVNKPRANFEVFNDVDSELINYLYVIKNHPIEFEQIKKGLFGLCSKNLFDLIKTAQIKPKNAIERAFFFYYRVKLSFAGQTTQYFGMNFKNKDSYKSVDNGLLSPLNEKVIERLRYVNILNYPFKRCYDLFENALFNNNAIEDTFIYCDPPYPGTENVYVNQFSKEDHHELIDILLKTKFNFMLSIGGDCDFYLDSLSSFIITKVKTVYSANAKAQRERVEYLIMNYDLKELGMMKFGQDQQNLNQFLEMNKK